MCVLAGREGLNGDEDGAAGLLDTGDEGLLCVTGRKGSLEEKKALVLVFGDLYKPAGTGEEDSASSFRSEGLLFSLTGPCCSPLSRLIPLWLPFKVGMELVGLDFVGLAVAEPTR